MTTEQQKELEELIRKIYALVLKAEKEEVPPVVIKLAQAGLEAITKLFNEPPRPLR